jgi:hypothetical protein
MEEKKREREREREREGGVRMREKPHANARRKWNSKQNSVTRRNSRKGLR